jgi:hypothetical protein
MTRPRRHHDDDIPAAPAAPAGDAETRRRPGHRGQHILRTADGHDLTDADIQALADEAEAGYDVRQLRPRPRP